MPKSKKIKVTLVRSPAGRAPNHRACVAGLGLRRQRHSVQVAKVAYLLKVEEA